MSSVWEILRGEIVQEACNAQVLSSAGLPEKAVQELRKIDVDRVTDIGAGFIHRLKKRQGPVSWD